MITLLLALVPPADACPTVATGTPSSLSFDVAQVAIVREGSRTTFSVSVNPYGDKQEFALVLPVSTVLEQDEITTLDADIFARLNAYSAPMRVNDAGCPRDSGGVALSGSDSSDSDTDSDTDADVEVEANYLVGEYEVTILSSTESSGLKDYLDAKGYFLPAGADERLAEYIDAGSYFLTAKVADAAAEANGLPLSPLQISYESEMFAIPIRLATLNSPGVQDMIVYAINSREDGRTGLANYTEFEVPDRCIWGDPQGDDFDTFYEDHFVDTWDKQGAGAWTVEYAGLPYDCNPCTGYALTEDDVALLGYQGDYWSHHLTRMRFRYTPDQAQEDLVLYHTYIYEPNNTVYADDWDQNYNCVESFCDGTPTQDDDGELDKQDGAAACGCDAGGASAWLGVAALGVLRRRRSQPR